MTQFSIHEKRNDEWYSTPFYTGPAGYKMCLNVNANGWRGCGMSVFVYLMRGEYDSILKWPFRGAITIQLVNHKNDRDHYQKTVHFNDAAIFRGAGERVTSDERGATAWGIRRFLIIIINSCPYIDNDCMTFRVTNVTVHSV